MVLLCSQFLHLALTAFTQLAGGRRHCFGSQSTIMHYRVIESTLRTCNNLLERLHASFFFYILTGPTQFLKIGKFLPSAVLISVAMMFTGLKLWVDASWTQEEHETEEKSTQSVWVKQKRPVLNVLILMSSAHVAGGFLFFITTNRWFGDFLVSGRVKHTIHLANHTSRPRSLFLQPFMSYHSLSAPLYHKCLELLWSNPSIFVSHLLSSLRQQF